MLLVYIHHTWYTDVIQYQLFVYLQQEFFDWRPSAAFDNSRIKKGNQEKAQEVAGTVTSEQEQQSLTLDSSPPERGRKSRTPSTFPRTRPTPGTMWERMAMENLRQQLSFSDTDEVCEPSTWMIE